MNAKKKKWIIVSLFILFCILSAVPAFASTLFRIKTSNVTLISGKTIKLKVTGNVKSKNIKWSSSNKKVAAVSKGTVKGKKPGKAVIKAKANGKTAECTVIVKNCVDVSSCLTMTFNRARKALGMNRKIPSDSSNDHRYSSTGNLKSSYISNLVLPDMENTVAVFSVYIQDKSCSFGGAKIGMPYRDVGRRICSLNGWIVRQSYKINPACEIYDGPNEWNISVYYKNGKVYEMMLQRYS